MAELTFIEKTHVYLLGGEELPCVSDLCRFLSREIYKDAPVWQVEAAALRGTAVHAATQALDTAAVAEIPEEYLSYLLAYKAFLGAHSVQWELVEAAMYHPELLYAGTIDRYGLLNGKRTLLDIKTTYTVHRPLCKASLNLYRLLLEARGKGVEQLCILHLKKDGTFRLVKIEMDDALPMALITIHNCTKKKKKKGSRKNG